MWICIYLGRATLVGRTIVLVDYDWVLDVLHDQVLEEDVLNEPVTWPRPRLYPHAVLCPRKYRT